MYPICCNCLLHYAKGEAGVQRVDAESCEEIVSRIGSLLFTGAIAVEYGDWTWNKGDKAVVLINNLGSISLMEMGIVCKYVLQYFGTSLAQPVIYLTLGIYFRQKIGHLFTNRNCY